MFSPLSHGEGAEPSPIRRRVLSLGAGVQSTTLALMAAHGHFRPVDCAIFADTSWEPAAVYEHLNVLTFLVHIVSAGNPHENLLNAAAGKRLLPCSDGEPWAVPDQPARSGIQPEVALSMTWWEAARSYWGGQPPGSRRFASPPGAIHRWEEPVASLSV